MKVLFYRRLASSVGQRLCQEIELLIPEANVESFGKLHDLILALQKPLDRDTVVLLLAETKDDVVRLLAFRELFSERRCILILPDSEPDTISKGHALYPRFLTYVDNDTRDVAAVLAKMVQHRVGSGGRQKSQDESDGSRLLQRKASDRSSPRGK